MKCPKCGNEVDYLRLRAIYVGSLRKSIGEIWADEPIIQVACPECMQIIFDDVDYAKEVMENEV